MFKNRHLRVKLGKDEESTNSRPEWSWVPDDYNEMVTTIARNTATVVAIYIAADALRKILIYTATSKL